MEAHEEIIGIRVVEHRGGIEWSWKALYDQPHRGIGEFPIHMLEAGAQLTVAVTWLKASWQITRFVNIGDHELFASDEPEFEFGPDAQRWLEIDYAEPISRGDIITEYVPFSASDGSGEFGKVRPCVVVSVSGREIRYRAFQRRRHSPGAGLTPLNHRQVPAHPDRSFSSCSSFRARRRSRIVGLRDRRVSW